MRLSRFFGGGKPDEPQEPDRPRCLTKSRRRPRTTRAEGRRVRGCPGRRSGRRSDVQWRARAADVIPGGASTGSKRAAALYGEGTDFGPTHFSRASGCHVTTAGGRDAHRLHHGARHRRARLRRRDVTRAVIECRGARAMSPACRARARSSSPSELSDIIPCAERVQFLKTGAEAMAAAVRIARTYTGKDRIVACGYFGWHDWASDARGRPASRCARRDACPVRRCRCARARVSRRRAATSRPSCSSRSSSDCRRRSGSRARARCATRAGAALIFDEIKTGFRARARRLSGVRRRRRRTSPRSARRWRTAIRSPPSSGERALMEARANTWISSTLASEATALAAARARARLARRGRHLRHARGDRARDARRGAMRAIAASGVDGVHDRRHRSDVAAALRRSERGRRASSSCAREQGVLFKRGAYNFRRDRARRRGAARHRGGGERRVRRSWLRTSDVTATAHRSRGSEPLHRRARAFLSRRRAAAPTGRA